MSVERVLGRIDGPVPGPLFLGLGGIHGNEPAGVLALQRVVGALREHAPALRGTFLAIAGNLPALAGGVRYRDRDLNRMWTEAEVARIRSRGPGGGCVEEDELRELLAIFEAEAADPARPVVFVDLHSSSGYSVPFTCAGDTRPNRRLARALPLPYILGLEEAIDGPVTEWFDRIGHVGIAVEGGQHRDPATTDRLEAAVWTLLGASGCLARVPDAPRWWRTLATAAARVPRVVEIRHRQVLGPATRFRMVAGFSSFDAVQRGQLLAVQDGVEVRAPWSGRVLLPLYQGLGEDGFFLGRDVSPRWLRISTVLRALRLDRVVHVLPGVQRLARDGGDLELLVDRRTARLFALEILHLLGFRRLRPRAGETDPLARRWLHATRRRASRGARSLPWRGR